MFEIYDEILSAQAINKAKQEKILSTMEKYFWDWLVQIKKTTRKTTVKPGDFYSYVKVELSSALNKPIDIIWKACHPFARRTWIKQENEGVIKRKGKTQVYEIV